MPAHYTGDLRCRQCMQALRKKALTVKVYVGTAQLRGHGMEGSYLAYARPAQLRYARSFSALVLNVLEIATCQD